MAKNWSGIFKSTVVLTVIALSAIGCTGEGADTGAPVQPAGDAGQAPQGSAESPVGDMPPAQTAAVESGASGAASPLAAQDDLTSSAWEKRGDIVEITRLPSESSAGGKVSHRIVARVGGSVFHGDSSPVAAGEVVTSEAWLSSTDDCEVRMAVARHGATPAEGTSKVFRLTPEPTLYRHSHTFQGAHPGARMTFEVVSSGGGAADDVEIMISEPRLVRTQATPQ